MNIESFTLPRPDPARFYGGIHNDNYKRWVILWRRAKKQWETVKSKKQKP